MAGAAATCAVRVCGSNAEGGLEGGGLKLRNALLDLYAAVRASAGAGGGSPEAGCGEGWALGAEEEAWPSFPDAGGAGGGWDWGGGWWGGGGEGLEDPLLRDPLDQSESAGVQWDLPI
jgi:hypothetical protein